MWVLKICFVLFHPLLGTTLVERRGLHHLIDDIGRIIMILVVVDRTNYDVGKNSGGSFRYVENQ